MDATISQELERSVAYVARLEQDPSLLYRQPKETKERLLKTLQSTFASCK